MENKKVYVLVNWLDPQGVNIQCVVASEIEARRAIGIYSLADDYIEYDVLDSVEPVKH